MIARLEKLFFLLLALCPFAMGAVYAFVNMMGGWSLFSERRTYAFYAILHYGFAFLPGVVGAVVICSLAWFVSRRVDAEYSSRRVFVRDLLWLFLLSFGLRAGFFLIFGRGMGNTFDPLWSWERACGLPLSDNRHVLFPAWMNFALIMKGFVSVFGNRFDLFQFLETAWGGVGSVAVFLLAREIMGSRRIALFAGLLHALSPNGIVYLTAGATPEHAAAPLFCLAAWIFLRSQVRDMRWGTLAGHAFLSGLLLGVGDAIKPFFPVFLPAALIFSGCMVFRCRSGHWRTLAGRAALAIAALVVARGLVCSTMTFASERAFGCKLSRADSEPHFLCIGLDRWGEGMTSLARHAQQYRLARLSGVPRKEAAKAAFKTLRDDWRGHLDELPLLLVKKTIWAWQEDGQGFGYYRWNLSRGASPSAAGKRHVARIGRYGGSVALVYYFLLMSFACLFAIRSACGASSAERYRRMLPGLLIFGFFCLLLLSESQGRYKCLVMPFVTVYAACAFAPKVRTRGSLSSPCSGDGRLCVVMPVYNEREAIGGVLEKWVRALDALGIDYAIRPYNDGSRDDSLAVMKEVAAVLNQGGTKVDVRDKPNGGHGNTILKGYREAAADGFGWVFQIDSDDEMGPECFPELWRRRNDFDFLVGIRDGRVQQLPRKIVSFVSRLCVRLFYGKAVWDVNTPYRPMRVSAFGDFFSSIPPSTFAPNVILSGLAARYALRCFEMRVPQHDRTIGEVSIKRWKLLKCAVKSFWQTAAFSLTERGT